MVKESMEKIIKPPEVLGTGFSINFYCGPERRQMVQINLHDVYTVMPLSDAISYFAEVLHAMKARGRQAHHVQLRLRQARKQ
jgi:uncharacterized protein YjaG (DUF416 family)